MVICEISLFKLFFSSIPQYYKSDMSKYGHLEVFYSVPSILRERESTVFPFEKWGATPYICI